MKTTERALLFLPAIGVVDCLCGLMIVATEPCCPNFWAVLPDALVLATPIWLAPLCPWRDPKSLGLLAARRLAVLWLGMFSFVAIWFFVDNPRTFLVLFLDAFRPSLQTVESRVMGLVLGTLLPVIGIALAVETSLGWRHMIQVNSDPT